MNILTLALSSQKLWDLGVSIEKDKQEIIQKEIDLNTINNDFINNNQIKALYSDNFIKPILQEIKRSIVIDNNIIKKYDQNLYTLPINQRISSIKKSFLNKEFIKFFNIHSTITPIETQDKKILTSMYIQNLYYTNQFQKAFEDINKIEEKDLSDELLLFKIKIYVKLKNIDLAKKTIQLFLKAYPDSDLLRYVEYENKLINDAQ